MGDTIQKRRTRYENMFCTRHPRRLPHGPGHPDPLLCPPAAASEGRLKPSTLSIYAGILRAHIDPVLGLRPLHALSDQDIEAFLCEKAAPREGMPGLAPRTVSNISTVLHGIFDHACRTGSLRESPAWTCPAGRAVKNTAVLDAREKKILTRHLLRRHRCLLHR